MHFPQVTIAAAALVVLASCSVVDRLVTTVNGYLDIKAETKDMELIEHYTIGDPALSLKTNVMVYQYNHASELSKRLLQHDAQGRTIIDLTPSSCTSQTCYSGSFQPPNNTDCDAIVAAQLYNSTGSLRAAPRTFVYVYQGTCAVVFQNPNPKSPYVLDYNWAKLGNNINDIRKQCFTSVSPSVGGFCQIKNYLNYTLDSVGISLQRLANE